MSQARGPLPDYPMAAIPGGDVHLRDDRVNRRWTVALQPFALGRHPVTAELYAAVANLPEPAAGERRKPAVNASWLDAVSFCNALSERTGYAPAYAIGEDGETVICDWDADGYRLPTEAEWQHACKAGTTGYRYGALDDIAWHAGNAGGAIRDVGGKAPNAWGLYDMLGNAWEWCWDVYDPKIYGSYRIFRGGSWAEEARGCGATCRRRSHPAFRIDDLGFRLARSVPVL
ncbi:formylglycine-generating enzyme family protein [Paenibacillus artemisiicola]|nr:SUMF1/EgtB/PvdO family nonheme iron enzyme [Paenibacillus artemisiicola]